jgi:hypothetical protein
VPPAHCFTSAATGMARPHQCSSSRRVEACCTSSSEQPQASSSTTTQEHRPLDSSREIAWCRAQEASQASPLVVDPYAEALAATAPQVGVRGREQHS